MHKVMNHILHNMILIHTILIDKVDDLKILLQNSSNRIPVTKN